MLSIKYMPGTYTNGINNSINAIKSSQNSSEVDTDVKTNKDKTITIISILMMRWGKLRQSNWLNITQPRSGELGS